MRRCLHIIILSAFIAACTSAHDVRAGEKPGDADHAPVLDAQNPGKDARLSVAIFDFDVNTPSTPDLGKQIAAILAVNLSGQPGFDLVNRVSIDKILQENALSQTGVDEAGKATKIGRLVGARLLITGKVFLIGDKLFVTAQLISTETSRLHGAKASGDKNASVLELTLKLSDLLLQLIPQEGPKLVANDQPLADPLPLIGLNQAMARRKLPKIAVQISEHHKAAVALPQTDPAAETAVRKILNDAGFTLFEGNDQALAAAGVTLVISGQGFSEFAARIGDLTSCNAHVEIKVKNLTTNEVVFTDQITTRAADLGENTAAKVALKKAGDTLALHILQHFEKTLPAEKAGK